MAITLAALAAFAPPASAHVRLQHPTNGNPLFWYPPTSISIVISSTGSDDIADGSHTTANRNAIAAWNGVDGSIARLVENTNGVQRARTDWEANDIHLVLFDEDNDSGFFPPGSGTVALTPVWFNGSGVITDADILFNGSGFDFTTRAELGHFDVQDVATHELGHLLGLDHSGWAGATMYPYVEPAVILHRSLSHDDAVGIRDVYPAQAFGVITGRVLRSADDSPVAGAQLIARDADGRPVASTLADEVGFFRFDGLSTADYDLYATPLDHPVSEANLGLSYAVETDYESTALGTFSAVVGQTVPAGDLYVNPDVSLRLGHAHDGYPLRSPVGATTTHVVRGAGLVAGSTLAASDVSIVVTPITWGTTQVTFDVTVPPLAELGLVDLTVTNLAGDQSVLVASIEITPEEPTVTNVTPAIGSRNGGTALTITGTGFRSGARVVLGPNIHVDGVGGGCTVVDDTTITLTTAAMPAGTFDAVVIDACGLEGRDTSAFQAATLPVLTSAFPTVGSASGGTRIVLRGTDFDAAAIVRIDGVQQAQVDFVDDTRLEVLTNAGVSGGPYILEIENPDSSTASSAFTYVAAADPVLTSIDPSSGSASGGETVVVLGANFTAATEVYFGADESTGLGGELATSVTFVDANTLEVVTPSHGSGAHSVLIANSATGQALLTEAAFTFESSGGGGGGCHVVPYSGGPTQSLLSMWWLAAAFTWLCVAARRKRRALARVRA
ncbi:MAG: IPT/TIG domain-containing protein [Planctomycetota bacterium]